MRRPWYPAINATGSATTCHWTFWKAPADTFRSRREYDLP